MAYENVLDTYADPVLSEVSIRYSNDPNDFLAEKVFPILPVIKKTGFVFKYDKSNLKSVSSLRTGSSRASRVNYGLTKTAYGPLLEHSLEIDIEKDIMDMYDTPLEPQTDATLTVTEMFELEKEVALAALLATTGTFTQNVTLSGTSQWSDFDNSTPFIDIETGVSTIILNAAKTPNTILMGYHVWSKLKNHPDMLERVKYSQLGVLTESILSDLINIPNILIGKVVQNTAADGQTDAMGFVWGKNAWLLYVSPTPQIRSISAGYTLTLLKGRYVDAWVEIWNKTNFVRVNDYYQQFPVAIEAVYLIAAAVA